jgi:hypothetical protein
MKWSFAESGLPHFLSGQEQGWQRQAESSELADGVGAYAGAIGKLRLPLPPVARSTQP